MAAGDYSFIDVAVLDAVRERFARADALAVLSTSLEEILWANGPGAALFGYADIETIMGADSGLSPAARRQIAATPGFPDIEGARTVMVRLSGGVSSRVSPLAISAIRLPDGEAGILLAHAGPAQASRSAAEIAARAISGIGDQGHHGALLGSDGLVLAASAGFAGLELGRDALRQLAAEVSPAARVAKRMVRAGERALPAGLARLTDTPALHLLLVVDEAAGAEETEPAPAEADEAAPQPTGDVPVVQEVATEAALEREPEEVIGEERAAPQAQEPASEEAALEEDVEELTKVSEPGAVAEEAAGHEPAAETAPAGNAAPAAEAEAPEPAHAPPQEPAPAPLPSFPIRFVWRTDAEGRVSALSPEFTAAMGVAADSIVGRSFRDVAGELGFDREGEIASLLERRDTWSGRTVLWPLARRGLRVPVDLAALPVYGRERNFEGFRGFGVARLGDAVADEPAPPEAEEPAPASEAPKVEEPVTEAADPFLGERPAIEVEPTPERRSSDKVIRLAERRPQAPERSLSAVEEIAFREIGKRLKTETGEEEPAETVSPAAEAAPDAENDAAPETGTEGAEVAEAIGSEPSEAASDAEAAGEPIAPTEDDVAAQGEEEVSPSEAHSPGEAEAPHRGEADSEPAAGAEHEPVAASAELGESVQADEDRAAAEEDAEAGSQPLEQAEPSEPVAAIDEVRESTAEKPVERAAEPEPARAAFIVPSAFALPPTPAPAPADTSILAQLPTPVLIHSGDVLHYANRAFLELTGYESVEALEEAGGLGELFADPLEDGSDDGRAVILRRQDGDMLPVEALLRAVPWRGGRALMLVLRDAVADATPRVVPLHDTGPSRVELEARVAEMRTILDTATDGVVLIAPDETIRSLNRPAEALFGFDRDDMVGKPFTSLFAVESQRSARDYLAGLADNGVASVLNDGREVIGREAQGGFIPLFMTIGKLPGESGYCAVMRDITHWKRAEEELTQARAQAERASSQKTEFLARISHEIRTPLNAIIGFSELMVDEKFGPVGNDRYRDYLRDINRSGNLVLDLVNDLLDISKIEAGEQEMSYEAVSLNETLGETVAMMQPQANRERVIIRSSFASRLPEIVADLRSIRQIALNLLSNAVRYTQAGGQVIVSTSLESSGDVVMRVRDTGIGMSAAEVEQALKPFKQINALKRSRGDGTGLGLPLTKAMVEANRARLHIHSTPGEGTLVEVVFPATRVLSE